MELLCEGVWLESLESDAAGSRATCFIDPRHPGYDGHFDAMPVLPACSQFELLEALARRTVAPTLKFAGVPRSKFLGIIEPGKRIVAGLARARSGSGLDFEFTLMSEGKTYTRGKIVFVDAAARIEGHGAPAHI